MSAAAKKFLETVGGSRCPCGHLAQRHRKPTDDWMEGLRQTMGECRDCDCRGLLELVPLPGEEGYDAASPVPEEQQP